MAEINFNSLKEKLHQHTWPSVYMFKFIVPANNKNMALLETFFSETAKVNMKQSANGNFISITATELMINPDDVIAIYKKASSIKGIIAL